MSDIPREYVEALIRASGMSLHLGMPREAVIEQMTKFANLLRNETLEAAEHAIQRAMEFEREECAKAAENRKHLYPEIDVDHHYNQACTHCAAAIRARGEK